jgi:hypothetical protein
MPVPRVSSFGRRRKTEPEMAAELERIAAAVLK